MLSPATHPGADSTSLEMAAHDSVCWWRQPGFAALQPGQLQPRLKEPYLVLDLGKFTARCRSCAWRSTPSRELAKVRFAYSRHVGATGPLTGFAESCCDGRLAWPSDGSSRRPQAGIGRLMRVRDQCSDRAALSTPVWRGNGGEVDVLVGGRGRAALD
jgi:hypothetical protein